MTKETDDQEVSGAGSSPAGPDTRETGQNGQESGQPSQQGDDLQIPMESFMPPQPVPVKADVSTVNIGGTQAVMLVMTTPAGMNYYFIAPDGANQLGRSLMAAARGCLVVEQAARPKLQVVRKKGLIVP